MQTGIPCMIMRGGTSKGLYFLEKDLPPAGQARDRVLLRVMGSPDARQIDGLGGATSVTSKVAILAPSARKDADIEYTFAQVSTDKSVVSYAGNCGNISSGVGPFSIESGLVQANDPETTVRIFNTNTQKVMVEIISTPGGRVRYSGDFIIAGVPGKAAPVKIVVENPGGTVCSALLPTGNPVDTLDVPGIGKISASFVDATNPLVFVLAREIGMKGTELPAEIDGNPETLSKLERIRGTAAQMLGFIVDYRESAWKTPGVPKLTIISPPQDYITTDGTQIKAEKIDLCSRMMSMQKTHPTYAMTGAMCTAAAAIIPGTLVNRISRAARHPDRLRTGHPNGIIESGADSVLRPDGEVEVTATYGYRTARLLAKAIAFYPDEETGRESDGP